VVNVEVFHRPWSLELLAWPGVRAEPETRTEARVSGSCPRDSGSAIADAVTDAELDAWRELLRREDGGTALLRMVRGFERTRANRDL
jgi:haloalkane dehalogenase